MESKVAWCSGATAMQPHAASAAPDSLLGAEASGRSMWV